MLFSAVAGGRASGETCRIWEKVEIALTAERDYDNPYVETIVWVDLKGPGFDRRCYGFWDGGRTYRVRVLATRPGAWTWVSGSNQEDTGLNGKRGGFTAVEWSGTEKDANPCRRGMIKASANGHAFEYADGTPYFLLGDTWWAIPTFRYRWYDDDRPRPIGPEGGFKDFVQFRKNQGYNCFAMIAAFPNWANDGRPAQLNTPDGVVLRSAWQQPGTQSAKDMHDENGNRAFHLPGRVPGLESIFPDLDRLNPAYFQSMDKKIDYLNGHGFVPFIEVARRDIGQAWKQYYAWPDSYVRYIQYIWSRYQANICLFSPIHLDSTGQTIPASEWNDVANKVVDTYGPPPFGTLAGTNSNPSTLHNFGHVDKARWLTYHQIGNRRTHDQYPLLTEIFNTAPPVPGLHGEPYYDGMPDAESGSDLAALYCRSGMYGSVLSGGLAGHIYGAGGWDGGMWGGNVEDAAQYHIWDALKWPSADQMRHLATFILSEGRRYQDLVPHVELLTPNKSGDGKGYIGWAYCARTDDKSLFLLYFEKDCLAATLTSTRPDTQYTATWFDPRTGKWLKPTTLTSTLHGTITLGNFPDQSQRSTTDWALKLMAYEKRLAPDSKDR
jgi:hypothetical protein